MTTEIKVPNIDDYSVDPDDLVKLSAEFRELRDVFGRLSAYSRLKALAMQARLTGHIAIAKTHEFECDTIYKTLPEWARW